MPVKRKRRFWFGAFAVQDSKEANHFEVADCVAKRGVRPSDDLFRRHCFPSFLAGRGRAGLPGERRVDCEMVDVPRLAIAHAHPCRWGTFAGAYPLPPAQVVDPPDMPMRGVRGSILARASTEKRFVPAKILADAVR